MSWNRVIDRAKQETAYRLGKDRSHSHTANSVVSLNIVMIVSDEGIPLVWEIESKRIESGGKAREILKSLNLLT